MGFENKFARFMRNTGPARFFIPAGLILIVFGILLLVMNSGNFVQTTAKVTAVTEVVRIDTEDQQEYKIEFQYDVDGKTYDGSFQLGKK